MDLRDQSPRARTESLLVEEVDEETLVYDLRTHDAHCLNPAAAFVWRLSDGRTKVREMVPLMDQVGLPPDESVVWLALSRLGAAGLIEPLDLPGAKSAVSRKEVLRALGAAAALTLLLPAVDSVVAPLAAQAASCIPPTQCNKERQPCSGLPVCINPPKSCLPWPGGRCRAQ